MKICFPIKYKPEGGLYTFTLNFLTYIEEQSIPFTDNLQEMYDVLFVNSWIIPYETIRQLKQARPHLRVAQRIDGSAQDYGRIDDADAKQAKVNLLADLTIFQSRYSQFSTSRKYKVVHQDGPIIYNPVDIRQFTPEGSRLNFPAGRVRVIAASWSTNRKKGISQIEQLIHENMDIDFVICGPHEAIPSHPNLSLLGHLDRKEMAIALRSCHVFLNLSENDPCPNIVLEALASGLPVLFLESGGVPELVEDCGVAIKLSSFRQGLDQVMAQHAQLSQRARERAISHFAPDIIFPQYLAAMTATQRRPLPSWSKVLKLSLQGYPILPRLSTSRTQHLMRAIQRRFAGYFAGVYRWGRM